MIIGLMKYNEVGEVLIGINTTRLWGHVCYQDMGQREYICNYGSCPHGKEGDKALNITQGCIQLVFESGMRAGT